METSEFRVSLPPAVAGDGEVATRPSVSDGREFAGRSPLTPALSPFGERGPDAEFARRIPALAIVVAALLVACSDSNQRDRDADVGGDARPMLDARIPPDDADRERDMTTSPDDASPFDTGPVEDAGPLMIRCGADDATSTPCSALCDGPSRWYWNGDSCFAIDCGACQGADCDVRGLPSEAECIAAHETCRSAICVATGGTWMWWAEECGDYVCGRAPPEDCEMGGPVCDCGPFRSIDESRRCVDDRDCPIPEPVTRQELCTGTGGMWAAICCDSECGVPCGADCLADACDCGQGLVFDDARGCIDSPRCHVRNIGETCVGTARCEGGSICCQDCGGAGCFGDPTCRAPSCDDDPDFDVCGNCTTCP